MRVTPLSSHDEDRFTLHVPRDDDRDSERVWLGPEAGAGSAREQVQRFRVHEGLRWQLGLVSYSSSFARGGGHKQAIRSTGVDVELYRCPCAYAGRAAGSAGVVALTPLLYRAQRKWLAVSIVRTPTK